MVKVVNNVSVNLWFLLQWHSDIDMLCLNTERDKGQVNAGDVGKNSLNDANC